MRTDGYKSKDKRAAVSYIANTSNKTYVKSQAERALRGEVSLDSALVRAHRTSQDRVRETANAALGIDE